MRRLFIFAIITAIFIFVSTPSHALWWMVYHKPEFKGKVIDAETKEAIEGAVVVVVYEKYPIISGPGGGSQSIMDIKEILTNTKGEFYFPSYTTLIQPFSIEGSATFIIFKPGYGSFPNYHVSPPKVGINPEEFFSRGRIGEEGEIEWKGIGTKTKVTFGIVELPKLKTREERIKAKPAPVGEPSDWKKQKQFIKAIRDEWQYLYNEDPGGLYLLKEEAK